MASLYKDYRGYRISHHSYSAGDDFARCQRLYKLKRIDGWHEIGQKAAFEFGKAIEAAIAGFHAGTNIVATFRDLWAQQRGADLIYTDREGSWDELARVGEQMVALYEIRQPYFGAAFDDTAPRFQVNYKKEVFPGSELAGISFTAYVDMLIPKDPPLVVDIKTSSIPFPEYPAGLCGLDPQLRAYAWVTGIHDVAFLWFTKKSLVLKADDDVVILDGPNRGQDAVVFTIGDGAVRTCSRLEYDAFRKASKGVRGKELEKRKAEVETTQYGSEQLTKQGLQFVWAHISDEDMHETGEQIGRQIVEIVAAAETGYPKQPGVRFPNQKCTLCPMLGICLGNDALRDKSVELTPR